MPHVHAAIAAGAISSISISIFMKPFSLLSIFVLTLGSAVLSSTTVFACTSCGMMLSPGYTPGWESQGLSANDGFRFDFRYDLLNQNQVRSGAHKVGDWPIAPHEQEMFTKTQSYNTTIDWSKGLFGVNVQAPYLIRTHATGGFAYNGTDDGTSSADGFGDMRVVGRFMGVLKNRSLGLQFGVKLPTGNFKQNFNGGSIAGQLLDRGLQLGTGTTDLIFGAFHFAPITKELNYYSQFTAQFALSGRNEYKPGNAFTANVGVRYHLLERVVPQLQLNARISGRDAGINASPDDSGGTTLYLSPGITFGISKNVFSYVLFQLPIYQYYNGYQLAPVYTLSVGTRVMF